MSYEQRIEATTPHKAKLTVSDFMLLDQAGAFANHARSELIEGEIYVVNATYRPHARAKRHVFLALNQALANRDGGLTALDECSSLLSEINLPQPDIVVTTDPDGDGPIPLASIRLIVEVADSSLATDLGLKAALYARHGVPEYWVVDIAGRRVVRHWAATDGAYAERDEIPFGTPLESRTLGLGIATDDLG